MANTYIKILLHVVFAVKNRDAAISPLWQSRLYAYVAAALRENGNFPIAIGGTDNHIHIFFSYSAKVPLPDLIRDIKSGSTRFINDSRFVPYHFEWQRGYSCFSYSPSQIEPVKAYIENQYEHHKGHSLADELKNIYYRFGIEYDERYIFQEPE